MSGQSWLTMVIATIRRGMNRNRKYNKQSVTERTCGQRSLNQFVGLLNFELLAFPGEMMRTFIVFEVILRSLGCLMENHKDSGLNHP